MCVYTAVHTSTSSHTRVSYCAVLGTDYCSGLGTVWRRLHQLLCCVRLATMPPDTPRNGAIARPRRRRSLARDSAPVPAALLEQLLADQLLARSTGQAVAASATRSSLLALASVASTRRHLACAGRVCAQIVLGVAQRDRLQTLLRRIVRSSSGDEVRVITTCAAHAQSQRRVRGRCATHRNWELSSSSPRR